MPYIKTANLRKLIRQAQPGVKFPLYRDRSYYVIPHDDLQGLVDDHYDEFIKDLPQEEPALGDLLLGAPEDEDCDDWADSFKCYVRRYYRKQIGINKAAAISEVTGLLFDGIKINHTKNIVLTEKGIFFVDAHTKDIKAPDSKEDKIWRVNF
jgi:hypothetical protein